MALDRFINNLRTEAAKRYGLKTDAEIDAFFLGMLESSKDNQEALEKRDKMLRDTVAELEGAKQLLKAAAEDIKYLLNHAERNGKACDRCKYGNEMYCYADDCSNDAKWQHETEALALIGEDTNVPAREESEDNA